MADQEPGDEGPAAAHQLDVLGLQHEAVELVRPETFDSLISQTFLVSKRTKSADTRNFPDPADYDSIARDRSTVVELELVQVKRFPGLKEREGGFDHRMREPFSLLFCAAGDCELMSSIHAVSHAAIGELQLFLNPILVGGHLKKPGELPPRYYETVFS